MKKVLLFHHNCPGSRIFSLGGKAVIADAKVGGIGKTALLERAVLYLSQNP